MEITITWTKLLALFIAYHGLRYLYHTYMKWVTGCEDPLDPLIPFDAAIEAEHRYREYWFKLLREQERAAKLEAELELARLKLKLLESGKPTVMKTRPARKPRGA